MNNTQIMDELHQKSMGAQVEFNGAAEEYRQLLIDIAAQTARFEAQKSKLLDELTMRWRFVQKCRRSLQTLGAEMRDLIADDGMAQAIADVEKNKKNSGQGSAGPGSITDRN